MNAQHISPIGRIGPIGLIGLFIIGLISPIGPIRPIIAFASTTDGTIDTTSKYAWGQNIGWVNFGTSGGNVHITDTALTGYVWSEQYGWINLAPAGSGVTNNAEGTLAGQAWGENLGYVNFSGVSINSSGQFTGHASGTNSGQINFDCSNCTVITDWRPASSRSSGSSGGSGGGGYGEPPFDMSGLPPASLPKAGTGVPTGGLSGAGESVLDTIYHFFDNFVPDFLKSPTVLTEKVSVETIVPKEAPIALKNKWIILPQKAIHGFVFAPLPKDIALLTGKFSKLKDTFTSIGITRQSDIEKLRGVALRIPGLADSVLPAGDIHAAKFGVLPKIPLVQLSAQVKQALPSEIVFVRVAGESIDLPVVAKINERGATEQRVNAVAGTILKLVVKPEHPAKQVLGYFAFKSRGRGANLGMMDLPTEDQSASAPRTSLLASMFASIGSTIEETVSPAPEERFVVREFSYVDPDGDGIYTANIQAPVVSGSYDIHTVIDYVDPRYANSDIKLTTVIDPEGYVYESIGGKELRIPGAVVSILWLNPATNTYELWPADKFSQENPQITDVRGTYAFLVPSGFYSINVSAPGYKPYIGKSFEVSEGGSGVHTNIELTGGKSWLEVFDWKTDLLILLSLLSAYNFYSTRKRRLLT